MFVHGLFSSGEAWSRFRRLLASDSALSEIDSHCFEYTSPKARFSLTRRIPSFDVLGDQLRTFLRRECGQGRPIVLVSHSQGGLIVQRFLARSLEAEQYADIQPIKMVVMFACPNSGSDIFLSIRRWSTIWRHPQERELRPLNQLVTETRRTILRRIVNADESDANSMHIPIYLYAGDEDNIVTSVSALDVFPAEYTGVISGDHSSIIQPQDIHADSYRDLRRHVVQVIESAKFCEVNEDLPGQEAAVGTDELEDVPGLIRAAEEFALQGQNAQAKATFLLASSAGDLDALQAYSRFQRQQGQLDDSIATSLRVIEKLADAEDSAANRVRRSKVLSTIGISQRNLGKLQRSERSLREAVSATHGDGDHGEVGARAYAFDNLGLTLMRSADLRGAKSAFYEARSIREAMRDESKLAPSLLNLARVSFRDGDFDAAEQDCQKALSLWTVEIEGANVAATYSLMGEIAFAKDDYLSAESNFGRALAINNDAGRSIGIALTQQQLGRALLMKGDLVAAETQAKKSRENFISAANVEGRVGAEQLLARIASANGDLVSAVDSLEDCVTSYRELGNLTGEAWSSFYLAEVLYRLGRMDSGAARLQRAAALADSISNASLRRSVETFSPH